MAAASSRAKARDSCAALAARFLSCGGCGRGGGVGTLDHLVDGVTKGHASAVLAASIFHFGTYTIGQAKAHMAAAGIPMRLT